MSEASKPYRKIAAGLLAAWFSLAVIAGGLGVFASNALFHLPLPLGLAVMLPIIVFSVWMASSAGFRQFLLSLDSRLLTLVQTWRIAGFVFLVLATYGILPRLFAFSAGWGDIAVGVTAPLAAGYLARGQHRAGFIAWQLFGLADLTNAIVMGVLSSAGPIGILAHGASTAPMAVLPLSLIPTFAVPLLAILHIICIAQASTWRQGARRTQGIAYSTAR
ncbi:MAG TPA: hypothetical protein VFU27_15570 [Terriglobales bacterium]|nr:hypothetical protein [Terriglobales bacterium]